MATLDDFQKIDVRVGIVIDIDDVPDTKKPMYKLVIDFGNEIGKKTSCAQLAQTYTKEELKGRRILGVVNFPPRRIGTTLSEVLTLGVPDSNGNAVLVVPDKNVPVGGRLY